jgi:WD40 repeat protein
MLKLRSMKLFPPALALLGAILACSLPGSTPAAEPSPAAVIPTATRLPTTVPSETPVPPTLIPPTDTPLPPVIGADTVTRLSIASTFGEGEALRSLAFSPDGTVLASAGGNTEDFAIRLWDVASGVFVRTLEAHTSIVWDVAFSPDGRWLASVSSDGTAKIWDWRTGSVVKSLDFPDQVVSVAFSPDGRTLVVGGVDGFPNASVWTFSVPSWQSEMKLSEYWNIPALVFSPDGQFLVGGGTSRNVRIWRLSDGATLFTLSHSGQVSTLAVSPDGSTVATGSCEESGEAGRCARGGVWLWDLNSGRLLRKFSDFPDAVVGLAYSVDGSLLIASARDGTLRFYSTSDDQSVFETHSESTGGVLAASSDGRLLATTAFDNTIDLWRVGP